jgi:hypothetical protein
MTSYDMYNVTDVSRGAYCLHLQDRAVQEECLEYVVACACSETCPYTGDSVHTWNQPSFLFDGYGMQSGRNHRRNLGGKGRQFPVTPPPNIFST